MSQAKYIVNSKTPTIYDVWYMENSANSTMLRNCARYVGYNSKIVPLLPYTDISAQDGAEVNVDDTWYVNVPPPRGGFTLFKATSTDLCTAFGAVAVTVEETVVPVSRVEFYKNDQLVAVADFAKSVTPYDYPYTYVPLPSVVDWQPGQTLEVRVYPSGDYLTLKLGQQANLSFRLILLPANKVVKT